MSLAAQLAQGVAELGLALGAEVERQLLDYVSILVKWNRVHNLTAVRAGPEMVSNHLLDSLVVVPHLPAAATILDVGSGAGLPGIPLALAWPQAQITLLDSNHKKAAFLRQAIIELGLHNATVIGERVEAWQAPHPYDLVISRAFSDMSEFLSRASRHCAAHGTVAAMKGTYPHAELAQLPPDFKLNRVVALNVPGLRAARHLVLLKPQR